MQGLEIKIDIYWHVQMEGGHQGCVSLSGSKFFHFHAVFSKKFAK